MNSQRMTFRLRSSSWFTLIEIVVAMVIFSLMASLAAQSYVGYSESERDAERARGLSEISSSLTSFAVSNCRYPEPDDATPVTWNGQAVFRQGVFGDASSVVIGTGKKYSDPLSGAMYSYSVTGDRKRFEVGTVFEQLSARTAFANPFVSQAYAAQTYPAIAGIAGTYGRIAAGAPRADGRTDVLALPSITLADLSVTEISSASFATGAFVVDGRANLPANYSGRALRMSGDFFFRPSLLGTYSGALSDSQASSLMEAAKAAYSWSQLASISGSVWAAVVTTASGSAQQADFGGSVAAAVSSAPISWTCGSGSWTTNVRVDPSVTQCWSCTKEGEFVVSVENASAPAFQKCVGWKWKNPDGSVNAVNKISLCYPRADRGFSPTLFGSGVGNSGYPATSGAGFRIAGWKVVPVCKWTYQSYDAQINLTASDSGSHSSSPAISCSATLSGTTLSVTSVVDGLKDAYSWNYATDAVTDSWIVNCLPAYSGAHVCNNVDAATYLYAY